MKNKLHHKLGIFGSCPVLLLQDRRLTPNCIRVYLAVQSFEGTDENSWSGIQKVAARAGISQQAVTKAVGKLIAAGWLKRTRRFGSSNIYECCNYSDPVEIKELCKDVVDMRRDRPQPTRVDGSNPRKKSVDRQPKKSVVSPPKKSVTKRPSEKTKEKTRSSRSPLRADRQFPFFFSPPFSLSSKKVAALLKVGEPPERIVEVAAWWEQNYHVKGKRGDPFALMYKALVEGWDVSENPYYEWGRENAIEAGTL